MVSPAPIQLANLGMADSLILMVLALVVFGPRRLPQIGRQIGKLMYEFRKASNDFKFQMEEELRASEDADRRKREEAERQAKALPSSTPVPATEAGTAALESPYPGEGKYPETTAPEPELRASYPRISPPATGEQVSAAAEATPNAYPAEYPPETKPTDGAEATDTSNGAGPTTFTDVTTSRSTEPTSQNG